MPLSGVAGASRGGLTHSTRAGARLPLGGEELPLSGLRSPLALFFPLRDVGNCLLQALLCFLAGTGEGDWRRSKDGTGRALHTDAAVLGAEFDLDCSGAGASADSIRSAQRRMSRSFFVRGLKPLHLLLMWVSHRHSNREDH